MHTFEIPGVKVLPRALKTTDFWNSVMVVGRMKGEAGAANQHRLILPTGTHPFMDAAYRAFQEHLPLTLTPDAVNLLLSQGLAQHVNLDPEGHRSQIVAHEGKQDIHVRRDDFVKGRAENPWQEVFPAFTDQIKAYLTGDIYDLIINNFSTTGPVEKAASEVVLMSAVQSYFELHFHTLCGIPRFTLTGTVQDWARIRDRAAKFSAYGLEWWVEQLLPVLDQFVLAADGKPDLTWWKSFFSDGGGSGGPYLGGNIIRLFPYLKGRKNEPVRNSFKYGGMQGPGPDNFFNGLSSAPFTWHYYEKVFPMEFVAGFVGVGQGNDDSLQPAIGWLVKDK